MMQNSIKIAITGGIGSGKSAVTEIIKEQGYPVFSCDKIYSELLTSKEFTKRIGEEFCGVLNEDGTLNRELLSKQVFNNSEALKKLNQITHPAIMASAFENMEEHKISFLEVPLLFENGFERLFDAVIVILRDREDRINSIIERDGISKENAILRLNSQINYDNFDFAKYYAIHNIGNLGDLRQKTLEILQKIKFTIN